MEEKKEENIINTNINNENINNINNENKEKEKEKEIIKKKIVKGFNSNNKKVYENKKGINNTFGKNKFNDDKISKGESEYESDNNQIKENIEAIYEPDNIDRMYHVNMYENVYAVQNISVVPSINNGVGGF